MWQENVSEKEDIFGYSDRRGRWEGSNREGIYVYIQKILGGRHGTHFSILVWRIPWTEEPGGLQSIGSQRVGHN